MKDVCPAKCSHRLLQLGVFLFLLGLLAGFFIHSLAIPKLGVTAHILAMVCGVFLFALGLGWSRLELSNGASLLTFALAIYGPYVGWFTYFLAGVWGAGKMFPIAAGGLSGTRFQETVISVLLSSVGLALIVLCILLLWGLRNSKQKEIAG